MNQRRPIITGLYSVLLFMLVLAAPYAHAKVTLSYSTYIGGFGFDSSYGIAVDQEGCAYITGSTTSDDFPTVNGYSSYQSILVNPVFVTKVNPEGDGLVYSTFLGSTGSAGGFGPTGVESGGIAVDREGCAYVTGFTDSPDFPVKNAFQETPGGGMEAFVAKLNGSGNELVYATYLGGAYGDEESCFFLPSCLPFSVN